MNKDQIQIVKDDLAYLLEIAASTNSAVDIAKLQKAIQIVCSRDLRILGMIK